ncbi:MAG: radical SAM protein [Spirochaetes bacterium]|nr:radical SAM protein [Spirochaetota bacterium]
MKKKYKMLLISPQNTYQNMWMLKEVALTLNKKNVTVPLVLPTLAAMTPGHYDIQLVDEEITKIPFDQDFDFVGITAMATNVLRAYEIADQFRQQGVPVIMGGPYTTLSYQESLEHSDSVLVGEAEDIWQNLLADFEQGSLKKIYQAEKLCEFKEMPVPRWDLIDISKIMSINVQFSRGCPNNCEFCCVSKMFGRKQRYRDINNVINEIKAAPLKQISFVDDNFSMNRKYAMELTERMKPLKIEWTCLTSVEVAGDPDLLKNMADSGCHSILIGFETLNQQSLSEAQKAQYQIDKYKEVVAKIHAAGIHVIAAFVVGFDSDTMETFEQIEEFCRANNISYVMLNILTVFHGTQLHSRLEKEGRLLNLRPEFLNGIFPTMKYQNFSLKQIYNRYFQSLSNLYSYENIEIISQNLFKNQTFTQPRQGGVSFRDKVVGFLVILKTFIFTKNSQRKNMFIKLFKMYRNKLVDIGIVVEYLLFIVAANNYIDKYRNQEEDLFRHFLQVNQLTNRTENQRVHPV